MLPTLLDGDKVWVNKLAYDVKIPLQKFHWLSCLTPNVVTLSSLTPSAPASAGQADSRDPGRYGLHAEQHAGDQWRACRLRSAVARLRVDHYFRAAA